MRGGRAADLWSSCGTPGASFFVVFDVMFFQVHFGGVGALWGSLREATSARKWCFGDVFARLSFHHFFRSISEGAKPRKSLILLRENNDFHEIDQSKNDCIWRPFWTPESMKISDNFVFSVNEFSREFRSAFFLISRSFWCP